MINGGEFKKDATELAASYKHDTSRINISKPSSPVEGDVFYDVVNGNIEVFVSGRWIASANFGSSESLTS